LKFCGSGPGVRPPSGKMISDSPASHGDHLPQGIVFIGDFPAFD
jgi:hypothetical protein